LLKFSQKKKTYRGAANPALRAGGEKRIKTRLETSAWRSAREGKKKKPELLGGSGPGAEEDF